MDGDSPSSSSSSSSTLLKGNSTTWTPWMLQYPISPFWYIIWQVCRLTHCSDCSTPQQYLDGNHGSFGVGLDEVCDESFGLLLDPWVHDTTVGQGLDFYIEIVGSEVGEYFLDITSTINCHNKLKFEKWCCHGVRDVSQVGIRLNVVTSLTPVLKDLLSLYPMCCVKNKSASSFIMNNR